MESTRALKLMVYIVLCVLLLTGCRKQSYDMEDIPQNLEYMITRE